MAKNSPYCYGIYDRNFDKFCWHDGQRHRFELSHGGIKPEWKARLLFELQNGELQPLGDVVGCGLFLDSENKLAIFFTLNGILRGLFCLAIGNKFRAMSNEIMLILKTLN
jgi:hypothetical protein